MGDVIKSVQGQRVHSFLELKRVVRNAVRKNDKAVKIVLLRNKKQRVVSEGISSVGLAMDRTTLAAFVEETK